MKNTRNILLIGKTGSGKSVLANVLINENNQFEEVFKEGKYGVSQTKKVSAEEFDSKGKEIKELQKQIEELEKKSKGDSNSDAGNQQQEIEQLKEQLKKKEEENVRYKIIDTVGISDTKEGTKMSLNKVLYNLAKIGREVEDGLSQILLVTDGNSPEQTNSLYNLLKETVFDENIAQYTTIVRTNFPSFEDEGECVKDKEALKSGGKFGKEIRIVHVDNPPINIRGKNVEKKKELNMLTREASREIMLNHLVTRENVYKPNNLNKLNELIDKEWKDKEVLKKKINKSLIKHIEERGSNLEEEMKERLKEIKKEMEEEELKQTVLKEGELSRQIGGQLIKELKELGSFLPKEKFVEWKGKINQLGGETIIGKEERELIGRVAIEKEGIIKALKEEFEEKKKSLRELKNNSEAKIKETAKKTKSIFNMGMEKVGKIISGGDQEENWTQERLEKICQAQADLTKSEIGLENVKKILERIENYKEQLEKQLEARIEVLSSK